MYETFKDSLSVKNKINEVRNLAKRHNLKLVFRDKTTNAGDFTFFFYKPEGGRFLVGIDGLWKTNYEELTFESCYDFAKRWVKCYTDIV